MATKQLNIKQYVSAINLFGAINELQRIEEISSLVLVDYLNSGEPKNLLCLKSLNNSVVCKVEILQSLICYLNIVQLLIKDSTAELSNSIIEFFSISKSGPNPVWPVLIVDLVGLVNNGSFVNSCSREYLYNLLSASELIINSPIKSKLYLPMIVSNGRSIVSKFNAEKDIDEALQLFIYSCLKSVSVI
ncbi:hypothetical protein AYI69_g6400 [Smittium culicis]|uniref:Uncharacterized protein n=1 Tax=Smittium culicis TaxID=133412 RepID=A0A1R1XZ61_9FUNG|nr:hypothetical protein AYI69_g6400 [Smittium culicis]